MTLHYYIVKFDGEGEDVLAMGGKAIDEGETLCLPSLQGTQLIRLPKKNVREVDRVTAEKFLAELHKQSFVMVTQITEHDKLNQPFDPSWN
jgi:hypothetical protein